MAVSSSASIDLPPAHKRGKIALIITTLLYAAAFIPSVLIAPMSLMGFDAPGAHTDPLVLLLVTCFLSLPVLLLLGAIVPWLMLRQARTRAAMVVALLPLIDLACIALMFALGS